MAHDKDSQEHRRIIPHLLILIGLGIVIYLAYEGALSYFSSQKFQSINKILVFFHPVIQAVSLTAFLSGGVTLTFLPIVRFAWDNFLSNQVDRFFNSTDEHLNKISTHASAVSGKIKDLSSDLDKYIKEHSGPLPLNECKTKEEFTSFFNQASSGMYGPQNLNPQSLYSHVKKRLLDSFCCVPHRSGVRKIITVSEHNNPEYVSWHERTNYNIHHVMFRSKPVEGHYPLRLEITSYSPDMTVENWSGAASLLVMVNEKRILQKDSKPVFEKNCEDEGFFCWKEGEWIILRFKKILNLRKEWTPVVVEEKTINSRDDKNYSLNTQQPTFGHYIDFTLPGEYAFIRNPFISPQLAVQGLPVFISEDIETQDLVSIQHDDDNHIRINMKDWILPGIIMNLNWVEIPNPDKSGANR